VTHVVRPGENLYRISRHYGVSVDAIVRANRITDVGNLSVGKKLFVPGTRVAVARQPLAPPAGVTPKSRSTPKRAASRVRAKRESNLSFVWPVRGRMSSRFGRRNGRPHEGVDIAAKQGTPILAAEAGRVIHSGWGLGAYGRVVIVKHAGKYSTVYAHNRKNKVSVGDFVERGQVIAQVGTSGNASGPHVHFEIRRNRNPQDPIPYLP
jgi:lipoprotein NlpD